MLRSRVSRLGVSRDVRVAGGTAGVRTSLSRRVFEHMAVSVINFGRVAARPTPHRLAGLRLLSWISDSRQAAAPRRSGVRGHNPALSGAVGHSPTRAAPYPTTLRHARTRNHYLITDEAYSTNSLRAETPATGGHREAWSARSGRQVCGRSRPRSLIALPRAILVTRSWLR